MFYRHGDVLLKKVDKISGKKREAKRRVTVALGEATGHHHDISVEKGLVSIYDDIGATYVDIPTEAIIDHQEHHDIAIAPGMYQILIERERDPFSQAIKTVVD